MLSEYEQMRRVCMAYEKKLIELMGRDAFMKFSVEIAKNMFADEIMEMPDCDFKEKTLDNFDLITGSAEDFQKLLGNIYSDKAKCFHCKHLKPVDQSWAMCELDDCDFEETEDDSDEG